MSNFCYHFKASLPKNKVLSQTPCINSISCQVSHSVSLSSLKLKHIWKVLSPAFLSSHGFLPGASTISPPWQWFLLSRFIHNSITFEEGSARGMVRSRCSQGPRVSPEECILLSHSHTGNWGNFQSRLCFTTAHQVSIVMISTIYPHPL